MSTDFWSPAHQPAEPGQLPSERVAGMDAGFQQGDLLQDARDVLATDLPQILLRDHP
jgi:hypothetical protein